VDVVVNNANNYLCIEGGASSRFWLESSGGWFAIYNAIGNPQDAISWGTVDPLSDLDGRPCIPLNNKLPAGVTQLASYNQIAAGVNNVNEIATGVNIGSEPLKGNTKVRFPDGSAWSTTISPSESSSYGSCNDPANCFAAKGIKCNGKASLTITNGTAPYTFVWDDDRKQILPAAEGLCPGKYTVTVTDKSGCTQVVSTDVLEEKFTIKASKKDPSCGESVGSIEVTADPANLPYTYTWSPNTTNTTNTATGLSAGKYTVKVSVNGCDIEETLDINTAPEVFVKIPNVFTPNLDNTNDVWRVDTKCVNNLNVVIYNRWGNVVYKYNDVKGEWDGQINGEKVTQGVYFYRADIEYEGGEKETKHGNITVIYE
jgi:gliding motility-associated-like protein